MKAKIHRKYPGYYLWSAGQSKGYIRYIHEGRYWFVVEIERNGHPVFGDNAVTYDCRTLRLAKESISAD